METKDIIAGYKAWRDNGAKEVSLSPEQVYTLLWNWPGFHENNPSNGYGYGDNRPMGEFFNALSVEAVLEEPEPEAPAKPNWNPEGYPALTKETALPGATVRYVGWKDHHASCPRYGYETKINALGRHGMQYRSEMDGGGVAECQNWSGYNDGAWVLVKAAPPAKPAYLPIKRKVRWADLEDGCVLRYCGNKLFADHFEKHGMLVVGELYTVRKATNGGAIIPYSIPGPTTGIDEGHWVGGCGNDPWEFVSNPNYVHGFRIGETVWSTGGDSGLWGSSTGYGPYTVTGANAYYPDVIATNKGDAGVLLHRGTLTRDPTKAYGYKAPVEYKAKDGVAKEGDVNWWQANYGDPEKVIVGGINWDHNKDNVKGYPNAYQLREPQKVWDYKNK